MKFDSYSYVVELQNAFKVGNDDFSYGRSYGRMCGFLTSALALLNLDEKQIAELNRMLEVAKMP